MGPHHENKIKRLIYPTLIFWTLTTRLRTSSRTTHHFVIHIVILRSIISSVVKLSRMRMHGDGCNGSMSRLQVSDDRGHQELSSRS